MKSGWEELVKTFSESNWDDVTDLNLSKVFCRAQAVARAMITQASGMEDVTAAATADGGRESSTGEIINIALTDQLYLLMEAG